MQELAFLDQLGRALGGFWESRDPTSLQNQLTVYIWIFVSGFTGTAAWRAKFRWMRLSMLITNQAIMLAMMATGFQKLITILSVPLECAAVLLVSIAISAWLFRFRKPKAYRELELARKAQAKRLKEQPALAGPAGPAAPRPQEAPLISSRWAEGEAPQDPPRQAPAGPQHRPPTFDRRE